jgi:hypothetical protein
MTTMHSSTASAYPIVGTAAIQRWTAATPDHQQRTAGVERREQQEQVKATPAARGTHRYLSAASVTVTPNRQPSV